MRWHYFNLLSLSFIQILTPINVLDATLFHNVESEDISASLRSMVISGRFTVHLKVVSFHSLEDPLFHSLPYVQDYLLSLLAMGRGMSQPRLMYGLFKGFCGQRVWD